MPRLFLALPLAVLLLASPSHADSAKTHVAAAHKAEKSGNWSKALEEWQAAYRLDANADYLIGMGDAYAKLGDKANARKQYNAYLADPLSLDTDGVKGKIAALDKPAADDLSLDLGGPAPAPKKVASADLDLDLAGPVDAPKAKKGGKKGGKKDASADLSLDLGGPDGLDIGPPAPAPKKETKETKVAANDLDLDLVGGPDRSVGGPSAKPKDDKKVASAQPAPAPVALAPAPIAAAPKPAAQPAPQPAPATKVAVAAPAPKTTTAPAPAKSAAQPAAVAQKAAPPAAVATVSGEPRVVEHNNRVIAYCTAGLAVGALAFGGVYYSKASANQSDVTAQIRSGAQQQQLLNSAGQNKSLALAGILTGVVLAGVTTALFVF